MSVFTERDTDKIALLFTLLPNKVETREVHKAYLPIKDKEWFCSVLKYKVHL